MTKIRIGILALQGAVQPHKAHIEALGCEFVPVKSAEQISDPSLNAMILPGGESSTMLKLISTFNLESALKNFFDSRPVWGVCAGSILMARHVLEQQQKSFALMEYDVLRNAYGSQLESFETKLSNVERAVFIRAPQFTNVGPQVEVMASCENKAVWLTQGKYMTTSFHPELSTRVPSECHDYFINEIVKKN